jgi:hypothetical protein
MKWTDGRKKVASAVRIQVAVYAYYDEDYDRQMSHIIVPTRAWDALARLQYSGHRYLDLFRIGNDKYVTYIGDIRKCEDSLCDDLAFVWDKQVTLIATIMRQDARLQ